MAQRRYVSIDVTPEDNDVFRAYTQARGMTVRGLLRVLAQRLREGQEL